MDIYVKIDGFFHYNFLEIDGRQNGIFYGYNGIVGYQQPISHHGNLKS